MNSELRKKRRRKTTSEYGIRINYRNIYAPEGKLAVSQPLCRLRVIWQLGTEKAVQLADEKGVCVIPSLRTAGGTAKYEFQSVSIGVYTKNTSLLAMGCDDDLLVHEPMTAVELRLLKVTGSDVCLLATLGCLRMCDTSMSAEWESCLNNAPNSSSLIANPGAGICHLAPVCRKQLEIAHWLRRKLANRKVTGPNPTLASRPLLSGPGQLGSISALVFLSDDMTARHRKGGTAVGMSTLQLWPQPTENRLNIFAR
ncbi:hypothetical protein CSKR_111221 [Clonorchis sinensis]|uniref:Uncharacterized protein n=1 Tax=Clonorchis sinensis TaxID=79923 RepID=A0A3R7HB96_CLOSI|nr:hypothetical protein CSKR_111221 [Clonorchis sinensis]